MANTTEDNKNKGKLMLRAQAPQVSSSFSAAAAFCSFGTLLPVKRMDLVAFYCQVGAANFYEDV